jgi:hypothetical protein
MEKLNFVRKIKLSGIVPLSDNLGYFMTLFVGYFIHRGWRPVEYFANN